MVLRWLPLLVLLASGLKPEAVLAQSNDPDLNGDGHTDLICRNTSTGDVTVWYMNGQAWMGSWDYIARGVPTAWKNGGSRDLNRNGANELIWQNTQTGDVTVWYMNGAAWTGKLGLSCKRKCRSSGRSWHCRPEPGWRIRSDLGENTQTGDVNYWLMSGINQMTTGTIAQAVPAAGRSQVQPI